MGSRDPGGGQIPGGIGDLGLFNDVQHLLAAGSEALPSSRHFPLRSSRRPFAVIARARFLSETFR